MAKTFDPEAFDRAAAQLLQIPGVVGVFWGPPRRKGRWDWRQRVIAVRVIEKLTEPEHPIPREIEGFRTDILAVGSPSTAALCAADWAGRHPDPNRAGVITAMVAGAGRSWALASGHASLPTGPDGRIVSTLDKGQAAAWAGGPTGQSGGVCVSGRLTSAEDWAILRFEGPATLSHPGSQPPSLPPFTRSLAGEGANLRHWSTRQSGPREGRITALYGKTVVTLPDGRPLVYDGVTEVRAAQGIFALNGDSGSLVFLRDAPPRAVGVVIAVTQGLLNGRPYHSTWIRASSALPECAPDGTPFFV